ncbi:MAG: alpha/beta fold hydrolase [Acidimicrobiales bacterium]
MPRATVDDVELHYETAGSGPRLVYLSGTGGDLRARPNVLEGPLPEHFEVLAYDQRGMGQSSVPPGPYTMSRYADDAAGIMDALGWDVAAVVGVSFGGMVAQELALRHPARIRRMVLACTSSGGEGGSSYPLHELVDLADEERLARTVELLDTREEVRPALLDVYRARGAVGAGELGRREGARLQIDARRRHDTWGRLGAVDCPTLVCGGRFDGIAPPGNVQRLAGAIPHALLALFEGGHTFLFQDPAALPAVIDFLES